MSIRLVAIDLDGPLLNSAKEITQTTAAILRTARQAHGGHIVLATARPPRSVMPFYMLLDLDTPMINYNGALVFDPPSNRVLLHRPIPLAVARGVVDLAREVFPEVLVSAEVLGRWYTDHLDRAYLAATGMLSEPDEVSPIDHWLTTDVTKLLLLGPPERLGEVRAALVGRFRHQVTLTQTEDELLQVAHATVSKVQALRTVAAELAVNRGEVMAIGDNANDAGMLRWAGIGVAMQNGAPEAIAAADMITDHHDADGAANAVRKVILEGRLPPER